MQYLVFFTLSECIEICGHKKGKKQVADLPDAYIVRDNTDYAIGNILPLWAFGLTY